MREKCSKLQQTLLCMPKCPFYAGLFRSLAPTLLHRPYNLYKKFESVLISPRNFSWLNSMVPGNIFQYLIGCLKTYRYIFLCKLAGWPPWVCLFFYCSTKTYAVELHGSVVTINIMLNKYHLWVDININIELCWKNNVSMTICDFYMWWYLMIT
jgi:hypothetical protein